MDASTPVTCASCGASRWQVRYRQWVDNTIEYTMTVPGVIEEPEEVTRKAEESLTFACAACGESSDPDRDEALSKQARRVTLHQDGTIDWQSEPGR